MTRMKASSRLRPWSRCNRTTALKVIGAVVLLSAAACSSARQTLPAPTRDASGPWIRALTSQDSSLRHAAARTLWQHASSSTLPAESLLTVLESDSGVVRLYTALTLMRGRSHLARRDAIKALNLHRSVYDSGLLWRAGGERAVFIAALGDSDPEVRYHGALAIRLIGIDASVTAEYLIPALADPESKVAGQARKTLIATGPLPASRVPDLIDMLHRRGLTGRSAANILGTMGHEAEPAIPVLMSYAKHGDSEASPRSSGVMRLAAVRALIGIGFAARASLDSLRSHPDAVLSAVADQALRVLASNTHPARFYPLAQGWVADAYESDMKVDLGNLVAAQSRYRATYGHYASDIQSLLFDGTPGITLMLASGNDGWSAMARHTGTTTTCSIVVGTAVPPEPESRQNEPRCME